MKYGEHLEKQMEDPEFRKLLARESLLCDITEAALGLMDKKAISQEELAELMGKSEAFVDRLFDGSAEITIPIIADVFTALGARLRVVAEEEV